MTFFRSAVLWRTLESLLVKNKNKNENNYWPGDPGLIPWLLNLFTIIDRLKVNNVPKKSTASSLTGSNVGSPLALRHMSVELPWLVSLQK